MYPFPNDAYILQVNLTECLGKSNTTLKKTPNVAALTIINRKLCKAAHTNLTLHNEFL